jgi:type IV pilus assembly protein PilF
MTKALSVALSVGMLCVLLAAGCAQKSYTDLSQQPQADENNTQRRVRLHTELAAGYYSRGQYEVALQELNDAAKLDSNSAPAHNVAGLIYMELKEDARADSEFQRAVQLAPGDGDIRNNYGWFLCQKNREKQSLEQFELAVRNPLYHTPEVALVNAGLCSARIGEIKAAEDYYRRALAAQPNSTSAHYGLADLSYKAAHYKEARASLRNALQTAPPSAAALFLGVCVERKLGDRQAEMSYWQLLRNRYPDSRETKRLQDGGCE